MKEHLSPEQIGRWMIGERTAEEDQHVDACAPCSNEIGRLQTALSLYRGSVRQWSGAQSSGPWQMTGEVADARRSLRWVLAAAAVLILAAIPVWTNAMSQRARERGFELAKADTALLEQVDAEISRAVPPPVEPLVKLVSWDAVPADGNITRKIQ
jgi:hypothetical protein